MRNHIRLEIITEDRMGITLEVLEKVYLEKINLISVEVFPGRINLKIKNINDKRKEELVNKFFAIRGVLAINSIELLDFEKEKRKLLTIIDSVDDGIVAVNKNQDIEMINSSGEKILGLGRKDVKDTNILSYFSTEGAFYDFMQKGEEFDNVEVSIINHSLKNHYLATGRPVTNDNHKTIGMVVSFSNFQKAVEIANIVTNTTEGAFSEIVGNSPKIEKIKKIVDTMAKNDSTALLRGESGTGKDLFAKAIHNLSGRRDNKFIAVNCAALPSSLMESELFGYEKGSFTGAINSGKSGLFLEADGGTIFLDEIAELPLALQAKLLRVLQEGVVRKIGSSKEEKINVRIIAATNKNLEEMIKQGTFREDLYYRLNVIPIFLPPLRERLEDLPILVKFIMGKLNRKLNLNITGADADFINSLLQYHWPGNIRELQNVIERAMILCSGNTLSTKELYFDLPISNQMKLGTTESFKEMKLKDIVASCEREVILRELDKNKSLRRTAKALGISHTALINKVKKYEIKWQ
ncbi:sigma 54-interacting transcriptional regulator [Alkaliphilus hydrothermalis]|uniref:HTH-type transcriptional regulatory protein TyrR n=1 Tax=Alkaliphilus hydrothermalis TaxID=1482730 RepID=A0ABS2NM88_9FIRM|nr:sigma 54-interacting transcriptional regulator [Alkaliphilus hydrothermalis]MBM7614043.1 transcriptional regulator of aroF, aroG, tyrA and aromatic amino acid transport [Alkaliphilus hydrothermalis]